MSHLCVCPNTSQPYSDELVAAAYLFCLVGRIRLLSTTCLPSSSNDPCPKHPPSPGRDMYFRRISHILHRISIFGSGRQAVVGLMFIEMHTVKSLKASDRDFQARPAPDSGTVVPQDCLLRALCFSLHWPVLARRAGGTQCTATQYGQPDHRLTPLHSEMRINNFPQGFFTNPEMSGSMRCHTTAPY